MMFLEACASARAFTRPIVLSRKSFSGNCSSGIASYIVLNEEGWVLTAHHVVQDIEKMEKEKQVQKDFENESAAIMADTSLSAKQKKRNRQKLQRPGPDVTEEYSYWFGLPDDRASVDTWQSLPAVDLALGKLEPFDPTWIDNYPVFKDPTKNYEPGTSLCKLGFPFHSIKPSWDAARASFVFPQGALPMPYFPIEGIVTRMINVQVPAGAPQPQIPLKFIETSSPGLRGQSGGPIFDRNGSIWAIQSKTMHLPLGFSPKAQGVKEHQFLNVGIGAHVETILGLLNELNIKHQLSTH